MAIIESEKIQSDIDDIEQSVRAWEISQAKMDEWRLSTVEELKKLNRCWAATSKDVSAINTQLAVLSKMENTCALHKKEIDATDIIARAADTLSKRNKDSINRAWWWLGGASAAIIGVAVKSLS